MGTRPTDVPKILSPTQEIPQALIYEIMDGRPVYYKGYKQVLMGHANLESIIGASALQSFLVENILSLFFQGLDRNVYRIFSNETGVHINHKNNLSHDIAIYEKKMLTPDKISKKYVDLPCKLAIEIDIKADLSNPQDQAYVLRKTQKILDFGTERLIWIFSEIQ